MRKSISESITNTIGDLHKSGIVDKITKNNIESLCIPDIEEYTPKRISSIRRHLKLSQAALASIFNVSLSTVQKWERGAKNQQGPR